MKNLIITSTLLVYLTACAPAAIGGGLAVATIAAKDKSAGTSVDDAGIWSKVSAAYAADKDYAGPLMKDVNVKVSEGRVLLTGIVANPSIRLRAAKLAWEQAGVREVINEVKLANAEKYGANDYLSDSWITTKVKAKLLAEKHVKSINYGVETIDGVVYLLGTSRSNAELDLAVKDASTIEGVKKVVSYMRVINDTK